MWLARPLGMTFEKFLISVSHRAWTFDETCTRFTVATGSARPKNARLLYDASSIATACNARPRTRQYADTRKVLSRLLRTYSRDELYNAAAVCVEMADGGIPWARARTMIGWARNAHGISRPGSGQSLSEDAKLTIAEWKRGDVVDAEFVPDAELEYSGKLTKVSACLRSSQVTIGGEDYRIDLGDDTHDALIGMLGKDVSFSLQICAIAESSDRSDES